MELLKKIWHRETASTLSIMTIRVGMLAAKFLLTIFIARYMGLEEVGVYGLIVAASGTLQFILRMGVFNYMARDAVHQTKSELTDHLRHYGTGILCLYIVLVPVAYALGYRFDHAELAMLALAVFVTEHFSFDTFILVNNLHKPKLANVLLSIQGASWIYLYIALAFFFPELRTLENVLLFWAIGGAATIAFALFLTRSWPWAEAFAKPVNWVWYKETVKNARHIYIADVVSVIALYMDRYLITIFLSLKLTGVYILFAQVENAIVNLVTSGVVQVYAPKLIEAFKEVDVPKFKTIFKNCCIRALASTAGLGLISAAVLPILIQFTDKPEATHYLPVFWLMMSVLLVKMSAQLVRSAFYPLRMDKEGLLIGIKAMFLTGISLAFCLNFFGIYGIIISTLMVSIIMIFITGRTLSKTGYFLVP